MTIDKPTFSATESESKPFPPPRADSDYGPDHTKSEVPKVNVRTPPRSAKDVMGKLGANKKLRSSIRKLADEDKAKLVGLYQLLGTACGAFHAKLSVALQDNAEVCAETWYELAETNDHVRRAILALVEGGAWGKVITAHIPIFMAAIPERVLERVLMRSFAAFGRTNVDDEFLPEQP